MTLVPDSLAFPFALEWMLGAALRSAALIGIAALVAVALKSAPAAVRHLVWTLALIGCAAMPLAALIVPGWSLPGLPAWSARIESAPRSAAPSTPASQAPAPSPAPAQASIATATEETPPTRSATAWRPSGADLLRALPMVWLAGALLMLAWHLLGWIRLSRVARRAAPMADDAWQAALARHAVTLRIRRPPALRVSPDVAVPFVYGARRPAIVVPAVAGTWSAERRDAVLLHELAHIRRLDLISARVTQLAATLYWFHPIVWIAARAQRAEAERACDDQVLDAGGRASAYASDLLEIARAVSRREGLDAAALAMARRSQLEGRLLAILDPRLRRGGAGRVTVLVGAVVAAGTIAALAAARPARSERVATVETGATAVTPVATAATAAEAPVERAAEASSAEPPRGSSRVDADPLAAAAKKLVVEGQQGIIVSDDKSMVGNWNYKSDRGARLSSHGKVRYSANLDDIESLSPDGWVEVEDRREGKWHKAAFRNRAGGIERRYQVEGVEHPWDASARAWLAGFLVELDRGSGALVEERFPRLLSEGGPDRVLREVSVMTSDYGRGVYLRRLAAADLDDATVRRAVAQAGREIGSDYELTQTLIAVAEHHALDDAATRSAYLEASNSLQSDYEHGRALHALIQRRDLSPALVDGAIASAARMESDYEQAQFMIALAEKGHVTGPAQGAYIRATHSMDSDYEKGRVLSTLLAGSRLASESVGHVLLATEKFQSDYERANVLVRLAESAPMSDAQRAAFVESTKGMSSDHERQRALAALAQSLGR